MRPRQRGFTLLELLIAMVLLSMVLVVVYGSLNTSMKSWDKGNERAELINELRLVQEFVRTQLRQSVTVYRNDSTDGRVIYFDGRADKIGWVAPMLTYLGRGGLYFVQLDTVGIRDDTVLRMRWYRYHPEDSEEGPDDQSRIEETVLLPHISAFKISYFGAEDVNEEPDWYSRWESKLERPQLVRIEWDVPGINWPPLVVALAN
jgi:general secretion pathway protein J